MNDILVPIGSTREALWAAEQAIALYRREPARIHLLNVQRPLPRHVSQFFNGGDLRDFHRDTGMGVLAPAIRMLDEAGVPHDDHVLVGHQAETIVRFAEQHHCDEVVLDNPPKGLLAVLAGLDRKPGPAPYARACHPIRGRGAVARNFWQRLSGIDSRTDRRRGTGRRSVHDHLVRGRRRFAIALRRQVANDAVERPGVGGSAAELRGDRRLIFVR